MFSWYVLSKSVSSISIRFNILSISFQFGVFLNSLAAIIAHDIRFFSAREVANIVHALAGLNSPAAKLDAKLSEPVLAIFREVDGGAAWLVENGDARNIANAAWACAALNVKSPSLFQQIEENAAWLVQAGTPQDISSVAWACASLKVPSPSLFLAIDSIAVWLVETGNPQDIANAAWACATLDVQSPSLFREIEANAAWLVRDGTTRAVASTAWACASLETQSRVRVRSLSPIKPINRWPSLFHFINSRAAQLVSAGTAQDASNLAWACGALKVPSNELFRAVDRAADRIVDEGTTTAVANAVWAFAELGYVGTAQSPVGTAQSPSLQSPSLLRSVEGRAAWLNKKGPPQAVARILASLAKLGVHAPSFFRAADRRAAWFVGNAKPRDVAAKAAAFATVGIRPTELFKCLAKGHNTEGGALDRILASSSPENVLDLAWSVAVLADHRSRKSPSLLPALWTAAVRNSDRKTTAKGLVQLAQVHAHARASGVALSPPPPPSLKVRMASACVLELGGRSGGGGEDECSRLLEEIGFEHERKASPFAESGEGGGGDDVGGSLAIDMACRERKIAVECAGERHFLTELGAVAASECSRKETGKVLAKRRLLSALGWKVVTLPPWDGLEREAEGNGERDADPAESGGGERERRKKDLKEKLAEFGVS